MASKQAHHATGWPAGIVAAAFVTHEGMGGPLYVWALLALAAGVVGGTAPDWLEIAWWSKRRRLWVTHRTVTHWGIGWGALLYGSYHYLPTYPVLAGLFGFACGGLMHLLADWPNPMGVPWIYGRHSLKLWNSGKCDLVVVMLAWVTAIVVSDYIWFHRLHELALLKYIGA